MVDGPWDGVVSLLDVTGTLTLLQSDVDGPVWCLTRGAVHTACPDPEQAMVWGFGRVAALEHPDRWGGLVDVPAELDERTGGLLAAVLADATEDQVAVRDTGVHARRLVRATRPQPATPWTPSGAVLVTGGTGALGAEVARWLVARGVGKLVLTGRRGPDAPGVADLVAELGVDTEVVACDVADRDALAALLAEHPVTAVVHAAGVDDGARIADLDAAALADVLRAKALGARHLDELLPDAEAFVVFSSIAGIWGSAGQAAYAAANAFLDAVIESRRARGRSGTAVAWGPWAGAGMAAGDAGEYLKRRGLSALPAQRALTALGQAVDADESCVTVADVEWTRFTQAFTATRPSTLFEELPEVRRSQVDTAPEPAGLTEFAQRLATASAADRDRALLDLVRTHTAGVLGHDGTAAITAAGAFTDLGFDSLTAVDLRNRLAEATGLALPTALVFDHPTPQALAVHLGAEVTSTDTEVDGDPGDARIREALAAVPLSRFRDAGVFDVMLRLAGLADDEPAAAEALDPDSIDLMDVDALIEAATENLDS